MIFLSCVSLIHVLGYYINLSCVHYLSVVLFLLYFHFVGLGFIGDFIVVPLPYDLNTHNTPPHFRKH